MVSDAQDLNNTIRKDYLNFLFRHGFLRNFQTAIISRQEFDWVMEHYPRQVFLPFNRDNLQKDKVYGFCLVQIERARFVVCVFNPKEGLY